MFMEETLFYLLFYLYLKYIYRYSYKFFHEYQETLQLFNLQFWTCTMQTIKYFVCTILLISVDGLLGW